MRTMATYAKLCRFNDLDAFAFLPILPPLLLLSFAAELLQSGLCAVTAVRSCTLLMTD